MTGSEGYSSYKRRFSCGKTPATASLRLQEVRYGVPPAAAPPLRRPSGGLHVGYTAVGVVDTIIGLLLIGILLYCLFVYIDAQTRSIRKIKMTL